MGTPTDDCAEDVVGHRMRGLPTDDCEDVVRHRMRVSVSRKIPTSEVLHTSNNQFSSAHKCKIVENAKKTENALPKTRKLTKRFCQHNFGPKLGPGNKQDSKALKMQRKPKMPSLKLANSQNNFANTILGRNLVPKTNKIQKR